MQKILEITQYRQKKLQMGRWLAMAIPGAGHVALGRTVGGVIWMLVVLSTVLLAVAVENLFGMSVIFWVALAPILLLQTLSVFSCYRIRKAR